MGFKQNTMGFKQNMMVFQQNMMEFTQYRYCRYIIDHFEWFFMEILTFSCSIYQYVGLRDIKLPMHRRLWRLWSYFLYLCKTLYQPFQGIFHGDRDFFLSLNCPECTHKKIVSRTFIINGALIVIMYCFKHLLIYY